MAQDIIDAEFETIRPARRDRRPPKARGADLPSAGNDNAQIGLLKAPPLATRLPPPVRPAYLVVLAAAAALAAIVLAGAYHLAPGGGAADGGLTLMIHQRAIQPAAARAVTVSATIRNDGRAAKTVPDIELVFESETGGPDLVFRLARGETLRPGKTLAFTVRMPKKPGYRAAPRLRFDGNGV